MTLPVLSPNRGTPVPRYTILRHLKSKEGNTGELLYDYLQYLSGDEKRSGDLVRVSSRSQILGRSQNDDPAPLPKRASSARWTTGQEAEDGAHGS